MSEKQRTLVILLTETVWQSWARDVSTVAAFIVLIGIGILLDSSAMQWTGAVVAFISVATRANGRVRRLTISEARAELDRLERDV